MNLDKQGEQELWWLLQKIKRLLPYPFKNQGIQFYFKPESGDKSYNLDYIPEPEEQEKLLIILKDKGVLDYKERTIKIPLPDGAILVDTSYVLIINKQVFDSLFQDYKQKYELQNLKDKSQVTKELYSSFNNDKINPAIVIGNKQLSVRKNQLLLCKVMYSEQIKVGKYYSWDIICEKMFSEVTVDKKLKKKLYHAQYGMNKRLKAELQIDKPLFHYSEEGQIARLY